MSLFGGNLKRLLDGQRRHFIGGFLGGDYAPSSFACSVLVCSLTVKPSLVLSFKDSKELTTNIDFFALLYGHSLV